MFGGFCKLTIKTLAKFYRYKLYMASVPTRGAGGLLPAPDPLKIHYIGA